ncbi:MAG: choice-of-anchor Q domain-containing protein, partial [Dokdonella sp.]
MTLLQSTISTNSAASAGGVFCGNPIFNLNNSTVAFNLADGMGGGGIVLSRAGTLQLKAQSSIVGKHAVDIGATLSADIARSQATVTMTGANDLAVAVDPAIAPPAGTIRSDPQLASLAANGGPTRTHALQSTSPAINGGNNSGNLTFGQTRYGVLPRLRRAHRHRRVRTSDRLRFDFSQWVPRLSQRRPVCRRTTLRFDASLARPAHHWQTSFITTAVGVRMNATSKLTRTEPDIGSRLRTAQAGHRSGRDTGLRGRWGSRSRSANRRAY